MIGSDDDGLYVSKRSRESRRSAESVDTVMSI